jgi:putative isomerase
LARLASLAGKTTMAAEYSREADELAQRIRALLWDEEDGFYYDRNARVGEPLKSRRAGWAAAVNASNEERIRVKSAASFTALWAGVATPEQVRRMVFDHLLNAREFWTPYPVATLAKSERWYSRDRYPADLGCNWRATVWLSTNYMIYRGLRSYGYGQLASLVAHRTHAMVQKAGNCEWYDAETGEGCGLSPFWGWSLLAHFMPYEEQAPDYVGVL